MLPGVFIGNVTQKVDGKKRVSVPAAFREALGPNPVFYASPSLPRARVVECRPESEFLALKDKIGQLPSLSPARFHLASYVLGEAHELKPDGNGRVVLPDPLHDHMGIDRKGGQCVFEGVGGAFNIYSLERYRLYREEARSEALKALEKLENGGDAATEPPEGAAVGA